MGILLLLIHKEWQLHSIILQVKELKEISLNQEQVL